VAVHEALYERVVSLATRVSDATRGHSGRLTALVVGIPSGADAASVSRALTLALAETGIEFVDIEIEEAGELCVRHARFEAWGDPPEAP
jgi:hypothetical protein